MKNLLLSAAILLSGVYSYAQNVTKQNTEKPKSDYTFDFFEGGFDQAMKEAAKKKKMIFVDAYTSWCGPCKMMNNSTFKDKAAGEFFNSNFISMKIDMEQGEGPAFAMKYSVRAYPTLLFISPKGDVVHKVLGYRDGTVLTEEGKKALALKK
ncbi:MAG: thioredoxin family protein [Flavobacteriales bacterium]|nr:thioredoxin family protein [Flavobacteriales bacterium]